MRKLALASVVAAAGVLALVPVKLAAVQDIEASFATFWNARSPREAESAAAQIVKDGAAFEEAWTRLTHGRTYASSVPHGLVRLHRSAGGLDYPYDLEVPEDYDPATRYPVRVQLHGGVMGRETAEPRGAGGIGALAGAEQIYVMPVAWSGAPWWSPQQDENLNAILDSLRRTYNVDENRVALAGVSDGGTAAYYFAMRDTTPFSSFLSLNGHIMVLENPQLGAGDLFPNNLLNRPLFAVNGALDRLYPAASVTPWIEHLQNRGVQVDYRVQPTGAHNTQWWPWVKEPFEDFVRTHPRNPYPDRLTWETGRVDRHNRASWLIIDTLRAPGGDPSLPDVNELGRDLALTFGVVGNSPRVSVIQPGSTAHRLGFRPGDTIVSVNGHAVASADDLLAARGRFEAGDALTIAVVRGGRQVELRSVFEGVFMPGLPMFRLEHPSGRVDLVRTGNLVEARARGVGGFTLLLSPEVFDFAQPVKVVVNGRVRFEGRVERSVATLLKWAARDNDRTMLFGAELHIQN